ncbi:MAG: hypothetical protein QM523_01080 [Candidatus Pacebacteria bacterium]|nr:hypothetical protein [Candidatus Paceibacterota bacterium]
MTIWEIWPLVSAIIIGNAVCFAFFMAALHCSRLQKAGAKDAELPWWVYLGLIAAPVLMAGGVASLN